MRDREVSAEEWDRFTLELNLSLGRYTVALAGAYQPVYVPENQPSGDPEFFCFPGFILAFQEKCLFITAGHLLEQIKEKMKSRETKWIGLAWCHFVPDSCLPQTLSMDNRVKRWAWCECDVKETRTCDEVSGSVDWGLISLTPDEAAWFREAGSHVFTEAEWKTEYDCDAFVLTGLPRTFFGNLTVDKGGAHNEVDPTIIGLWKRGELIAKARGDWFVGNLPREAPIDLRGMSGGPLFAFNMDEKTNCWVVGVQSHWCTEKRIAFVCPMRTILRGLPKAFRP
jgi:hypothetical protein